MNKVQTLIDLGKAGYGISSIVPYELLIKNAIEDPHNQYHPPEGKRWVLEMRSDGIPEIVFLYALNPRFRIIYVDGLMHMYDVHSEQHSCISLSEEEFMRRVEAEDYVCKPLYEYIVRSRLLGQSTSEGRMGRVEA